MTRALRLLPALLYMAGIFYLSSKPVLVAGVPDKLAHFTAYGPLAGLLLFGLMGWMPYSRAWIGALVLTILYGLSDEFHQSFVPGRTPDVWDVVADAAGGLIWLSLDAAGRKLYGVFRPDRIGCRTARR